MASLKTFNSKISNGALGGKKLPTKLKILNWGENTTNDGSVTLNDDTFQVFDDYQRRAGRDKDVPIDFDHNTVKGSKEYVAGAPKVIAGYGNPVLVKGDGLYLYDISWTPAGEKYARNYKDLSPAAVLDRDGVILGLDSVALTPTGAVNDLNFYSNDGFTEDMIKEMSAVKKEGFVMSAEYNKEGANPAVKITKDGPELNAVVHDASNAKCECAECKSANEKISPAINAGDKEKKTKTMSAKNPSLPDAYRTQPNQYNTMNDSIVKMAAVVGMEGETDAEKVLFAFLAKYEGLKAEIDGQITHKGNTGNGGLQGFEDRAAGAGKFDVKPFSADIEFLKKEIESLKAEKEKENAKYNQSRVSELVAQASREGKIVPFSADRLKTIEVSILEEVINGQPKNVVPIGSTMRTMGVQEDNKPSREKSVNAFNSMIRK